METYIFNKESLEYLIGLNKHCIQRDYVEYLTGNKEKIAIKEKDNYKIGIIIPNCNYEEWIEKCLSSVEKQTYKNYEVIFIDDCSTDNSVKIAEKFLNRIPLKIVELKQKRYNGGARNEGYLYLSDDVDYVWYIDSDDWIVPEALEIINANLGADVLFVGLADTNGYYYIPNYKNKYEAIKGWSGSSGKVIKKELATSQLYQEGTLKEDRTQHYKITVNMNTYKCIPDILYTWNRKNTKSVTTIRNKKWKADTIRNYADAVEMYEMEKGRDIKIDQLLLERIYNTKNEVERNLDSQQ